MLYLQAYLYLNKVKVGTYEYLISVSVSCGFESEYFVSFRSLSGGVCVTWHHIVYVVLGSVLIY